MLKIHPPAMFTHGLFQARRVTNTATHVCAAFLVSRTLAEKATAGISARSCGVPARVGDIVLLGQGGQAGYEGNKIHVSEAKGIFYRTDIAGVDVDLPLAQSCLFTSWMALRRKEQISPLSSQDQHLKMSLSYVFDEVITMRPEQVDPVLMDVCMDGAITRSFGAVPSGEAKIHTGLMVARDRTMKAIGKALGNDGLTALERVRAKALLNDFEPVITDLDRQHDFLSRARAVLQGLQEARKDDLADILMSDPVVSPMKNPVAVDFTADATWPRPH